MTSVLTSKLASVLGVTAIVVLLDLLLSFYVTSHGFTPPANGVVVAGVKIQLQWLPILGIVIVALATSYDVFSRLFPRWLGPGVDPIARLNFLRVISISLVAFVFFLYIPYLMGSGWFWRHLSQVSHIVTPLQGFGAWLEAVEMPIISLDAVWQYSITQILASASLVLIAWALARPAKRPKKIR